MMANHGTPLVVRASLPRTFLGLGIFVDGCLISAGIYLLFEVLRRPLEASQMSVLASGVLLSLATVLLFYLARPKRHDALASHEDRRSERGSSGFRGNLFDGSVQDRQRQEQAMNVADRLPGPM